MQSTHPSPQQLVDLALDRLEPEARDRLQTHVSACATCQAFLTQIPPETLTSLRETSVPPRHTAEQSISSAQVQRATTPAFAARPQTETPAPGGPSRPLSPPADLRADDSLPLELRQQTKYRIVRLLGRGGMGSVYEAHHERMDRRQALKVINTELVDNPEALLRFEEEIKAVAKLDHPNIARAYDAESFGSLQTIVMEFVPGQTLHEFLKKRGRLSVVEACRCVRQACLGLQHAHERGIVHRDLKPQNLMLARDSGVVKILDFGLAKIVSENKALRGLTKANMTMGTYEYSAPEQALDAARADIRADIYSLGCTIYYLIAGVLPFDYNSGYDTDAKLLLAHQNETPRPLCEVRPETPRELSELVDRMLAKNPADRPQTPGDVAKALLPFAKGATTGPTPEKKVDPGRAEASAETRHGAGTLGPRARTTSPSAGATTKWSLNWPPNVPRNRLIAAGVAAALFGLVLFAVLIKMRTPDGTLVVELLDPEATVQVLNAQGKLLIEQKAGAEKVEISVVPGKGKLRVVKNGVELLAQEFSLVSGGRETIKARFVPPVASAAPIVKTEPLPLPAASAVGSMPLTVHRGPEEIVSVPKPQAIFPPATQAGGPDTDLLRLIDPKRDAVAGEWKCDGKTLITGAGVRDRLEIPFEAPAEYRLTMVAYCRSHREGLQLGLVAGSVQVLAILDGWSKTGTCLGTIDGRDGIQFASETHCGSVLRDGEQNVIKCEVRANRISVDCNGTRVIDWTGAFNRLSLDPLWRVNHAKYLFIGSWETHFEISKLELSPLWAENAPGTVDASSGRASVPETPSSPDRRPPAGPKGDASPAGPPAEPPAAPVVAAPPPSQPEEPAPHGGNLPIPDEASQERARKLAKEAFGDELSNAKSSSEKQTLAKKLIQQAAEAKKDPAAQYVLLELARGTAVEAGDGAGSFDAIDKLADLFQIDSFAMKQQTLAGFAKTARSPAAHKAVAEKALAVMEEANRGGDLDVAGQLGKIALAEALNAHEKELAQRVRDRVKEAERAAEESVAVEAAVNTLKEKPDDPDANATVGRHKCLAEGKWDAGLPMLAKGSDNALKDLAAKDLQRPAKADDQVAMGDAWWDWGAKEEGGVKKQAQGRAGYWYQVALPEATGLVKTKIDKRLAEAHASHSGSTRDGLLSLSPEDQTVVSDKHSWNVRVTYPKHLAAIQPTTHGRASKGFGPTGAATNRTVNSSETINIKADFVEFKGDAVTLLVTQDSHGAPRGANEKRAEYLAGRRYTFPLSAFCDGDKKLLKELKDSGRQDKESVHKE